MELKNRIKEHTTVKKSDIRPNPNNWRLHPTEQIEGLKTVLNDIGFVDELLVIEDPEKKAKYMLIDGEARWSVHQADDILPVAVLDLSEDEAKIVLTTFDPISSFAGTDPRKLEELMKSTDMTALEQEVSDEMKTLMTDIDEKFATGYQELPAQETDAYFVENERESLPPSEYMKNVEAGTVPVSAQSIQIKVTPEEYEACMQRLKELAQVYSTNTLSDTFVKLIQESKNYYDGD
tara:strand:+ start:217 stop:921 length:705 start_codon:yes stop_codon:yes gene_type:complete